MLCKCHWIVLYTVHFTAFCLGGPFFPGHGVVKYTAKITITASYKYVCIVRKITLTNLFCKRYHTHFL